MLEGEKARRLHANTLYIPSVQDIRDLISAIPPGVTLSTDEARSILASRYKADTACPAKINSYWRWLAFAMEFEDAPALPWWRMTMHGKLSDQMPGGIETHRDRLDGEGVRL